MLGTVIFELALLCHLLIFFFKIIFFEKQTVCKGYQQGALYSTLNLLLRYKTWERGEGGGGGG